MTRIGLTLNEAKTSIKQARRERFDFLGYPCSPKGRWRIKRAGAGNGVLRDYRFLPIRHCRIQGVQMTAGIFIIDVKLGAFLDYGKQTDLFIHDVGGGDHVGEHAMASRRHPYR